MIKKNILANLVSRTWGFLSIYLFVPLYLKFLGIEAYGLVGFYSTLLSVLALSDMGFTATLNREMARLSVVNDSAKEIRDLLRTYELIYLFISSMIILIVWVLAPVIATTWLKTGTVNNNEITYAIRLMGLAIAFQMPSGLYTGGLMGLQKQVRANALQISWSAIRGIGAVLVLWFWSPTIIAFTYWQILSNLIYCIGLRVSIWRVIPTDPQRQPPQFNMLTLSNTWRYAAGMACASLLSTIVSQSDKLVISKMLPLGIFGTYTIAGQLASITPILISPVALAVFPRFTASVAVGDRANLIALYHRISRLAALIIIPTGLTLVFFAQEALYAWTGSITIAHDVGIVASLLVIGQIIQALMVVPYYLALAFGYTKLTLQMGVATIVLITPLSILLILKFGAVGGGLAWAMTNIFLSPSMYFLHRRLLPGEFKKWFSREAIFPLLIVLPLTIGCRLIIMMPPSRIASVIVLGVVWLISTILLGLIVSETRHEVLKQINKYMLAIKTILSKTTTKN